MLRMRQDMSHEFLMFCLLFPSSFGGLPIMSPLELIYRGHPDPVTSELVWLKHLGSRGCSTAKVIMAWVTKRQGIHTGRNYKMLIQDSLALNWGRPQQAANILKDTLESTISDKAINKDIRLLLLSYSKSSYDQMVKYLMTITLCVPRVLNEILRNSPEGAKLNFLSTFIDMRSMKGVMEYEEACSLLESLRLSDLNKVIFMVNRFKEISGGSVLHQYKQTIDTKELIMDVQEDWACTSHLADKLREISWGVVINGSTISSFSHPLEQFVICFSKSDNCSSCSRHKEYNTYLLLDPEIPNHTNDDNAVFIRGNQEPYWGSGTVEKKTNLFIKVSGTDRALDAAKRLSRIRMWVVNSNTMLAKFIDDLIKSCTELGPDMLELVSGVYFGGSVTHRFANVMSKHVSCPNIKANIFTIVRFITNVTR